MAQQLNIEILIDGSLKVNPFISLVLNQSIEHHHHFELRFSQDLKQGNDPVFLSKYQSYLGKSISITFGEDFYGISIGQQEHMFKGIITNIQMMNDINDPGSIVITGSGASYILESNQINTTHTDKSLDQIVKALTTKVPSNALSINCKSVFKDRIPYLVQYKENTWNFLKRISSLYGEWMYFDGKEFIFGKPSNFPQIDLEYPQQISSLGYSISTAPISFSGNTFMLEKLDKIEKYDSQKASVSGLGNFQEQVKSASEDVHLITGKYSVERWQNKAEMQAEVKAKKGGVMADLVQVTASSDSPGVQVGTIVDIQKDKSSLGKFLIVEVFHSADGNGNYSNQFKAIPSETEYLPAHTFERPFAENQIGKVISNDCPEGKGKIQVQLLWQTDEPKADYPWVDVLSPSSGAFSDDKKNRGIHFTPEVDDYVMVSFSDGDPSKPFVSGSVSTYDRRSSSANSDNFEKTISTRSGNTIYFRDKENSDEQELRIETDPDNFITIQLKGKDGTISIKSSKDILIESKKLIDFKSQEFKVRANKITLEAKEDMALSAKGEMAFKSEKAIEMNANKGIKIETLDTISLKATKKLEGSGLDVDLKGTKSAKFAAAMAEFSGSAMTTIKGAIVKIN